MKRALILLTVGAFALLGCGKTAEQKKMEGDLAAQVTKLHDGAMSKIKEFTDLTAKLDGVMAKHDSLAKAYPKLVVGHTSDDITMAKEKLASLKSAMDSWMKTYKPYDESTMHDEAVTQLKKNAEDLTKMTGDIDAAVAAANAAVDQHTKAADDLLASVTKGAKKVVKK